MTTATALRHTARFFVAVGVLSLLICLGAVWFRDLLEDRESETGKANVENIIKALKVSGCKISPATTEEDLFNPRPNDAVSCQIVKTIIKDALSKGSPPDPRYPKWDFSGSLFFFFTVMTTIASPECVAAYAEGSPLVSF